MRIRHFGFLAHRCRVAKLKQIRIARDQGEDEIPRITADVVFAGYPCPRCRPGTARVCYAIAALRWKGG